MDAVEGPVEKTGAIFRERIRVPELSDILHAGYPWFVALQLEQQIVANPQVAPQYWWFLISDTAGSA